MNDSFISGFGLEWRQLQESSFRLARDEEEHEQSEDEETSSPPKVNVDAERALVDLGVADQPVNCEDGSEDREHEADGKSEVEVHSNLPEEDVEADSNEENDDSNEGGPGIPRHGFRLGFRRERIDEAFKVGVRFGPRREQ